MKKALRIVLKVLKIFLIVLVVAYAAAYIYIRINKEKIIAQITRDLSDKMNGKVTVGDADISLFSSFPRIAVQIDSLKVIDTQYAVHHHAFIEADKLFVNIAVLKLITGKPALNGIQIETGSLYLFTDTSGYSNGYLLQSKKDPEGGPKKSGGDLNLKKITLKNFRFTLEDRKLEKLHKIFAKSVRINASETDNDFIVDTDVDLEVGGLGFNLPRGSFLENTKFTGRFPLKYGKITQMLSFDSIDIKLNDLDFNLTGRFDLGEKNPAFDLRLHNRRGNYEAIKKILPVRIQKSLAMASVDKPLDATARLHGPLRGGEPFVYASWIVKDSKLKTIFFDFDKASFTGFFTNEVTPGLPRLDPNSMLALKNFTGEWRGLPINSGTIEINNLTTPTLTCDLQSSFPLRDLEDIVPSSSFELTAGQATLRFAYRGPVQKDANTNAYLNGFLKIDNGAVHYTPRNVNLTALNGLIRFQNSNLNVENLNFNLLNSKFLMNGTATNLLTLINTAPNKVALDWNVYSPAINLEAFTFLLQSRKSGAKKTGGKNSIDQTATAIDRVMEQSSVNLSVKADRVAYKKLTATNFDAHVSMLQDQYVLNNISMNAAGGSISVNGKLQHLRDNVNVAALNTTMNNVDVQRIFYIFDDFGQAGITHQNLEGKLSAKVNGNIQLNDAGTIVPASMRGGLDFSLKNGALNNYEPIKAVQRFVFKKRDFDNIRFAELKDHFDIDAGQIKMNRMEIQSSVLTLFVEGIYDPKKGSDISIQVPLNNLKKRGEDYNPENIGTDRKGGRSVFLRGRTGSDGNVGFKLDLFNKFAKQKADSTK